MTIIRDKYFAMIYDGRLYIEIPVDHTQKEGEFIEELLYRYGLRGSSEIIFSSNGTGEWVHQTFPHESLMPKVHAAPLEDIIEWAIGIISTDNAQMHFGLNQYQPAKSLSPPNLKHDTKNQLN
jgi:hypothetical protein